MDRSTKRITFLFASIVFALTLAACNVSSSPSIPTPISPPTSTPSPISTLTLTPSATYTLPPTATFTPAPGSKQTREKDGMVMVLLSAGTFKMGSSQSKPDNKPVHAVTLDSFWIDQSEVTNAMYRLCVDAKVCSAPQNRAYFDQANSDELPVVYVNWGQANTYCGWVDGRLPSEAEWEYAARGGLEQKLFVWGDEKPSCDPQAPNGEQTTECSPNSAVKVKSFQPNGYGLYDMAGNVWEWVHDWYDSAYYKDSPARDPQGPETGRYRVNRGGSWVESDFLQRVASRNWYEPEDAVKDLGFRCARD